MDTSAATADGLPPLPKLDEVVGGRFEIRTVLGEGGMGHVYRAYDRELGREVALKLLIPRYLGRPEREARLFREAELMQRVGRHASLVTMLETGRLGPHDWPYLLMDVVEGESLWGRIAFGGAVAPNVAVTIARQIAAAVATLHRVGVVHRDVTPMNVLVEGNHVVLIDLSHAGDFGTPQAAVGRTGRLTGPHEVPGTHHYMSREQACAEPAQPSMDVYAFGVTLVHMVTGVAPSGLPREAFIALAQRGMVETPAVDLRVHPEVPRELAELADACTQVDPTKRPTMDEIVARLDGLLLTMLPLRRPPRKVYPVGGAAADVEVHERARKLTPVPDPAPTVEPVREARGQSRRWLVPTVAVVVVATIGVLWLLLRRPEPPHDEPPAGVTQSEGVLAADGGVQAPPRPAPVEPRPDVAYASTDDGGALEVQPETDETKNAAGTSAPPRTKRPIKAAAPCVDPEPAAAQAMVEKAWNEVLALTAKPRCWTSADLRWSYRAMALYGLGRHEQCLSAASHSKSSNAQRAAAMCREALQAEGAEP